MSHSRQESTGFDSRFASCASCAVGVQEAESELPLEDQRKWFVAIIGNNTENTTRTRLQKLGYEVYMPSQKYVSVWKDGRRKTLERVLLPGMLLVKLSEAERREIVKLPWLKRFLVNRAAAKKSQPATIPDEQIERLKFMLDQSETPVNIEQVNFNVGDEIRIIRGDLSGLTGNVYRNNGKSYILVMLDCLGCATCEVSPLDIEKK